MKTLVDYLNKHYPQGFCSALEDDFRKKHSVRIRRQDELFQFKYWLFDSSFSNEVTGQSRGHIVAFTNGKWVFRSRPFDKFFNRHEGFCPINAKGEFERLMPEFTLIEKADGTMIQLWWDPERQIWRLSTTGRINAEALDDFPDLIIDQLFLRVLGRKLEDLDSILDKNNTYLFELCAKENAILTKYPTDRAYLLTYRNTQNGDYATLQQVADLTTILKQTGCNLGQLFTAKLSDLGLSSLNELADFIDQQSKNPEFPDPLEGFVIWHENMPVAKMKTALYKQFFSFSGGDMTFARKKVVEAFFQEQLDDVWHVLNERLLELADSLPQKVRKIAEQIERLAKELFSNTYPDRKSYAQAVLALPMDKRFKDIFFRHHEQLQADPSRAFEFLMEKLQNHENWKKFMDLWLT